MVTFGDIVVAVIDLFTGTGGLPTANYLRKESPIQSEKMTI